MESLSWDATKAIEESNRLWDALACVSEMRASSRQMSASDLATLLCHFSSYARVGLRLKHDDVRQRLIQTTGHESGVVTDAGFTAPTAHELGIRIVDEFQWALLNDELVHDHVGERIREPNYHPFQWISDSYLTSKLLLISSFIENGTLRDIIAEFPQFDAERLDSLLERERVLAFGSPVPLLATKVEPQAKTRAGGEGTGDELQKRVASLERHRKKHAKPLTKTEKTRNQRIKFCCPRRRKKSPDTWNEIYHDYAEKFPNDKTASPDTLLHSHDRNCPKCREQES